MLNRRELLTSASFMGMAMIGSEGVTKTSSETNSVVHLLGGISQELLNEYPDRATFMGLDVGPLSSLSQRLPDRSIVGETTHANSCFDRLRRLNAVDRPGLSHTDLINLDTVTQAHELAAEGYRNFRFGDNAVVATWQMQTLSPNIVSQADGPLRPFPTF